MDTLSTAMQRSFNNTRKSIVEGWDKRQVNWTFAGEVSTKIWHKRHWQVIKGQGVGGLDEYSGTDLSGTEVDW